MTISEKAETLLRRILPDLNRLPLYIVPLADCPLPRGFAGCFHHSLCEAVKPMLEQSGKWQGSGVAIVANLNGDEGDVTGLILHEIAHWLTAPKPKINAAVMASIEFAAACRTAAEDLADFTPVKVHPAVWSHGPQFIRACCHLQHRAMKAGEFLWPHKLGFAGSYRGMEAMTAPLNYASILHDECEANCYRPLAEVLATAPPAEFSQLWDEDLRRLFDNAMAASAAA